MLAQAKRPQLKAAPPPTPHKLPLKPATEPAMPMPSVFMGGTGLERPKQKKQANACPACEEGGATCPECQAKRAPTLERPPAGAQMRRGSPGEDPAERQADELGKRIGDDLSGTESVGHGPLPKRVREVAESHLGVSLEGTHIDAGSSGQRKAKDESALAVTEGRNVAFGEGQLATSSADGRALLGHELVHVGQQVAAKRAGPQLAPDPAQDTSIKKEQAPKEKPKPPPGTWDRKLTVDGYELVADPPYLHSVLEDVAEKADSTAAASKFAEKVGSAALTEFGPLGGATGGVENPIVTKLNGELAGFKGETGYFIKDLKRTALANALTDLADNEKAIKQEERRYGLSKSLRSTPNSKKPVEATEMAGLIGAARELKAKQAEIDRLKKEQWQFSPENGPSPNDTQGYQAGMGPPQHPPQRYVELARTISTEQEKLDFIYRKFKIKYPILAGIASGENPASQEIGTIAADAGGAATQAILVRAIDERLDAIKRVREEGEDLKALKFPGIVVQTLRELNVKPGSVKAVAAREAVDDESTATTTFEKVAFGLSILAFGASLLVPPAGAAAAALTTAGLGLTLANMYHDYESYKLGRATTMTAFDRAAALSVEEPGLGWLATDIAFAIVDLHAASNALKDLAPAARLAIGAKTPVALERALAELRAHAPSNELAASVERTIKGIRGGLSEEAAALGTKDLEAEAVAAATKRLTSDMLVRQGGVGIAPNGALTMCYNPCAYILDALAGVLDEYPEQKVLLEGLDSQARAIAERYDSPFKLAQNPADKAALDAIVSRARPIAEDLFKSAGIVADIAKGPTLEGLAKAGRLDAIIASLKQRWSLSARETQGLSKFLEKFAKNPEKVTLWDLDRMGLSSLRGKLVEEMEGANVPGLTKDIDFVGHEGGLDVYGQTKSRNLYSRTYTTGGSFYDTQRPYLERLRSFVPDVPAEGGEYTRVLKIDISEDLSDEAIRVAPPAKQEVMRQQRLEISALQEIGRVGNPPVVVVVQYVK